MAGLDLTMGLSPEELEIQTDKAFKSLPSFVQEKFEKFFSDGLLKKTELDIRAIQVIHGCSLDVQRRVVEHLDQDRVFFSNSRSRSGFVVAAVEKCKRGELDVRGFCVEDKYAQTQRQLLQKRAQQRSIELLPADHFMQKNGGESAMTRVTIEIPVVHPGMGRADSCPKVKYDVRDMYLTDTIGDLKKRLCQSFEMDKQGLACKLPPPHNVRLFSKLSGFLRDHHTLAHYNIGSGFSLTASFYSRGGRRVNKEWLTQKRRLVWQLSTLTMSSWSFLETLNPSLHAQDGEGWHGVRPPPADTPLEEDTPGQPTSHLTTDTPKIVLVGDSVLDNFAWLKNPARCLRVVLQEKAKELSGGQALEVLNIAVDQMTTFDSLYRLRKDNSWAQYAQCRSVVAWEDPQDAVYLTCQGGKAYSTIQVLKRINRPEYLVVSLAGNDVYLRPQIQGALFASLLPFNAGKRRQIAVDMCKRILVVYREIMKAVSKETNTDTPKPPYFIPVIPYHPHKDFPLLPLGGCLGGVVASLQWSCLSKLVTPLAEGLLRVAVLYGLPVIDLSQTLNPRNESHYGSMSKDDPGFLGVGWSGAEPSDVSQSFIADLILHIATHWQPGTPTHYRGVLSEDASTLIRVEDSAITPEFIKSYRFGPS